MQFSAVSREINCETTATWMMTVKPMKPLKHTTAGIIVITDSLINSKCLSTCMVVVSSSSKLNRLPTELSRLPYDAFLSLLANNADPDKMLHYHQGLHSRLGMSVTTQGGSGRQYVTGSRRNLSKYRFVLLNVYHFRET